MTYLFTEYNFFKKNSWVVSEKIHGTNFSFITNGYSIVCAKRSKIIKSHETFFSYQRIFEKYKNLVMNLWEIMNQQQKIRGLNNQIIVYGELFGGEYPHPSVKQVEGVMSVQRGIYYCSDVEWKAIDIHDGEDFVEWDEMKDLLYNSHIPFIGELTRIFHNMQKL
jgi:Rnl2 family RNA ligase